MTVFRLSDGSCPYEVESAAIRDSGSFGQIYKARRQGAGEPQTIAVKAMHEISEEAGELLRKEYDCLRSLGAGDTRPEPGPPVPTAYGQGTLVSDSLRERPAFAMEYFDPTDWPTLRELLNDIADGSESVADVPGIWVMRLGMGIAKAIEACHKRGVVHRDLSDTNILVRRGFLDDPEVVVVDFGTAEQTERWRNKAPEDFKTRGQRGTKLFESPEMREGIAGTMLEYRKKPATDLFSIGALLVYARLSMEYSCSVAANAMEQSGGFAYQMVPLLKKLGSDAGTQQRRPITVADMELGSIARTLTNYHPTKRYFGDMGAARRMETLLTGHAESSIRPPLGKGQHLEDELDSEIISELIRLSTPMSFRSLVMKMADDANGDRVETVRTAQDGLAWLHEDGTLVIGPSCAEFRAERRREEYTHGTVIAEWRHINVGSEAASHPWSSRALEVRRVVAPVLVDREGDVKRLVPLTMHGWFEGMGNVRQFDLAGIDTSRVSDMADLFRGCASISELMLPNTWSYGSVRTMERMFSGCKHLRQMSFLEPLSEAGLVLGTGRVASFRKLFEGCVRLGGLNREGLACVLDTSGAQYLDSMFSGCSSLTGLDLTCFRTDKATGFSSMFESCASLEWIRQDFSMKRTRWTESMFRGCVSIREVVIPDEPKADNLYSQPQRAHPSSMFAGCSSLETVSLGGLLDHPLTSTWHLFSDCSSLKTVSISGMDTDGAQDMGGMFSGCESLEEITGIQELRTGSATTFGMMFSGCRSLRELDLSGWDTRSLRTFSHMFKDCTSLMNLDISGWDTSSITAISYAFDGANDNMTINVGDGLEFPQIRDTSQYVKFASPAFARQFAAE
ncbi:MAG: BspA family leucine-rich repeat surface protein [Coriobacteriales bacterium]|nr:BspA family leucine-rich repeat surface protein [Coriobacteriales bacterium]